MTKEIPNFQEMLVKIASALNELNISYAVTGGFAVSVWGRPRSTLDIDTLIRFPEQQINDFLFKIRQISPAVYVDEQSVKTALARGGEFNVIDPFSGVKVDFWIEKNEYRSLQQLARRIPQRIKGVDVYFLSPEDLIVSKLIWFQKSQSTRHLEDIDSILAVSGDQVDREYVNAQSHQLGVVELWRNVSAQEKQKHISFSYESTVLAEQGPRPSMEDFSRVVDEQNERGRLYSGVYDGHGGTAASQHARDDLSKMFLRQVDQGMEPPEAFREAYRMIDQKISDAHTGSCALDAFIRSDGLLWFASVGDSRLLIMNDHDVKQYTSDHRVSNPSERERIKQAGGVIQNQYIIKDEHGLEITRSLGDHAFRDAGVIATPETGNYQLQETDRWLVIATDGLFDVLSNENVAELLQTHTDCHAALEDMKQLLEQKHVTDNITVILVRISHE